MSVGRLRMDLVAHVVERALLIYVGSEALTGYFLLVVKGQQLHQAGELVSQKA